VKAAIHTKYGSPDVLTIQDIERPVPKDNEVLIQIHATTVNRTDNATLHGTPRLARLAYGFPRPKHTALGCEFAGQVVGLGSAVTNFTVGDDVVGYNDATFGGHAEYMVTPANGMITHLPTGLGHEDAAPMTEGSHYALRNLRDAGVTTGHRVLVLGGTGAIRSAAVQLAKHFGADVIATCTTPHIDLVRSLGASRVIDYTKEDLTVGGTRYDLVFDSVGKSSFRAAKKLLKPGGIYCSSELGFLWQNPFLALWTSKFGTHKLRFPIPKTSREDIDFLKGLVESGEFRPIIDRAYPLDQIVDAFRYVATGEKMGNVVISINHDTIT
jgi:NADPH:quinone reductase-like Zn-dependent oxidoreductase